MQSTEWARVELARAAAAEARVAARDEHHLQWLREAHAARAPLQVEAFSLPFPPGGAGPISACWACAVPAEDFQANGKGMKSEL